MITILEADVARLAVIELHEGETVLIKTATKPDTVTAMRIYQQALAILRERQITHGVHLMVSDRLLDYKAKA